VRDILTILRYGIVLGRIILEDPNPWAVGLFYQRLAVSVTLIKLQLLGFERWVAKAYGIKRKGVIGNLLGT
jgi:hypothetical protein